jgi:hypothetical protein
VRPIFIELPKAIIPVTKHNLGAILPEHCEPDVRSGDLAVTPFHGGRGQDVERVNHYPLYELGKTLRNIGAFSGTNIRAAVVLFPLHSAIISMNNILNGIPFPLGVSRGAAIDLKNSMQRVWGDFFTENNENGESIIKFPDETSEITSWAWSSVIDALGTFETVFRAEMAEMTTYFVPKRGIYTVAALAETADDSFPVELSQFIPDKTKADWRAAGRCMAFNLLEACGFHVARAVEGTMEAYYQLFSGIPGKTLRSWDDYCKELEKIIASAKSTPLPEQKTLVEFDQMRKGYRNPIVHPRVTLDEADARIIFNNGESLIIAMASEMKRAQVTQGGVQPVLSLIPGATSP